MFKIFIFLSVFIFASINKLTAQLIDHQLVKKLDPSLRYSFIADQQNIFIEHRKKDYSIINLYNQSADLVDSVHITTNSNNAFVPYLYQSDLGLLFGPFEAISYKLSNKNNNLIKETIAASNYNETYVKNFVESNHKIAYKISYIIERNKAHQYAIIINRHKKNVIEYVADYPNDYLESNDYTDLLKSHYHIESNTFLILDNINKELIWFDYDGNKLSTINLKHQKSGYGINLHYKLIKDFATKDLYLIPPTNEGFILNIEIKNEIVNLNKIEIPSYKSIRYCKVNNGWFYTIGSLQDEAFGLYRTKIKYF